MKKKAPILATPSYLQSTLETSVTLKDKQRQLLILDLNGTLCSRTSSTAFTARPHARKFFEYVFNNFMVMVWSSAQSHSVKNMCKMFAPFKPQIIWDRSHLGLTKADFNSNVQTVKNLKTVWQKILGFSSTNTIVLDDSESKLALQPYNLVKMSTFDYQDFIKSETGERDLLKVMKYLKTLQYQSNVANYMRFEPFDVNQDYGVALNEKEDKQLMRFAKGVTMIYEPVVEKRVKLKWTAARKREAALKRAADLEHNNARRNIPPTLKDSIETSSNKQPSTTQNKEPVIQDYGVASNGKEDKDLTVDQPVQKKVKPKWTAAQKREAALKRAADLEHNNTHRNTPPTSKNSTEASSNKQPVIQNEQPIINKQPVIQKKQPAVQKNKATTSNRAKPNISPMVILPNPLRHLYDQTFGTKSTQ